MYVLDHLIESVIEGFHWCNTASFKDSRYREVRSTRQLIVLIFSDQEMIDRKRSFNIKFKSTFSLKKELFSALTLSSLGHD